MNNRIDVTGLISLIREKSDAVRFSLKEQVGNTDILPELEKARVWKSQYYVCYAKGDALVSKVKYAGDCAKVRVFGYFALATVTEEHRTRCKHIILVDNLELIERRKWTVRNDEQVVNE